MSLPQIEVNDREVGDAALEILSDLGGLHRHGCQPGLDDVKPILRKLVIRALVEFAGGGLLLDDVASDADEIFDLMCTVAKARGTKARVRREVSEYPGDWSCEIYPSEYVIDVTDLDDHLETDIDVRIVGDQENSVCCSCKIDRTIDVAGRLIAFYTVAPTQSGKWVA